MRPWSPIPIHDCGEPLLPLPQPESRAAERTTGAENFSKSRNERDMDTLLVMRPNWIRRPGRRQTG